MRRTMGIMRFITQQLVASTCQVLGVRLIWGFTRIAGVQLQWQKKRGQQRGLMVATTAVGHATLRKLILSYVCSYQLAKRSFTACKG